MDLHERLKAARAAAGYKSAPEAARAFGWNINTTNSNENGNRTFSRTSAEKYARAYKVNLDWLLTGRGQMKAQDPEGAEIVDIWTRIPERDRAAAKAMLQGLAKKT
jgi:transcriptional regulator with XRE-family HTH domain